MSASGQKRSENNRSRYFVRDVSLAVFSAQKKKEISIFEVTQAVKKKYGMKQTKKQARLNERLSPTRLGKNSRYLLINLKN